MSYAPPVVTRVSARYDSTNCENDPPSGIRECADGVAIDLDVAGTDFGSAGAVVLVGSRECVDVEHFKTNPHGTDDPPPEIPHSQH